MSVAKKENTTTETEYLTEEQLSEIKHEYVDGHIYAMSGASKNHRILCGNIFSLLHQHLKNGPCEPSWDARVKTASNYFYPDVVVDCDDSSDSSSLYAEQPKIIIEVLSRSTRHMDRGAKLLSYIKMPSMQEYVLVEQEFASIDVLRRSDGWVSRHYALGDTIHLESIGLDLSVEEIYHRINNEDVAEFLAGRTNNLNDKQ
jgi:Uma2 family endonuclease